MSLDFEIRVGDKYVGGGSDWDLLDMLVPKLTTKEKRNGEISRKIPYNVVTESFYKQKAKMLQYNLEVVIDTSDWENFGDDLHLLKTLQNMLNYTTEYFILIADW